MKGNINTVRKYFDKVLIGVRQMGKYTNYKVQIPNKGMEL